MCVPVCICTYRYIRKYVYIYTCIHTYARMTHAHLQAREDVHLYKVHVQKMWICTKTPTYILTCLACIPTYIHTYIHTCMHACMHAYIRTYIHTCLHTCMHTYIDTWIDTSTTYIHAYIQLLTGIRTYVHQHLDQCIHTHTHRQTDKCT